MKKFLITVLSVIVGTTGLISIFNLYENNYVAESLSDVKHNIFVGSNDTYYSTLMTGEREIPYALDGVAEKLIDFGILTLHFKIPTDGYFGRPTYKLSVNDETFEGELEKNPYDLTYVADIKTAIDPDSEVSLLVEWGDLSESIEMNLINADWQLDWENALELAIQDIGKKELESFVRNRKFQAETHVEIIGDPKGNTEQFYWYVSIYGKNGSLITIVIDPITSEIITRKILRY